MIIWTTSKNSNNGCNVFYVCVCSQDDLNSAFRRAGFTVYTWSVSFEYMKPSFRKKVCQCSKLLGFFYIKFRHHMCSMKIDWIYFCSSYAKNKHKWDVSITPSYWSRNQSKITKRLLYICDCIVRENFSTKKLVVTFIFTRIIIKDMSYRSECF